jgi:hypothetical protein
MAAPCHDAIRIVLALRVCELSTQGIRPLKRLGHRHRNGGGPRNQAVAPNCEQWGELACSRGPFSQPIEPVTLGKNTPVRNAITRRVVLGPSPAHYFTSAALNQDSHDEFSAEVSTW